MFSVKEAYLGMTYSGFLKEILLFHFIDEETEAQRELGMSM